MTRCCELSAPHTKIGTSHKKVPLLREFADSAFRTYTTYIFASVLVRRSLAQALGNFIFGLRLTIVC